jgi:hypothetical protein
MGHELVTVEISDSTAPIKPTGARILCKPTL